MINPLELIGLPVEQAAKKLPQHSVEIVDFSRPDKFHKDLPASKRVVKVQQSGDTVFLYVAGFADRVISTK